MSDTKYKHEDNLSSKNNQITEIHTLLCLNIK